MSYDLVVFDPLVAPRDREAFMSWYREQTDWARGRSLGIDYNSHHTARSEKLQAWLLDMFRDFPPMNGPLAHVEPDFDSHVTDYSIGPHLIYAAFAWSVAEEAYRASRSMAEKHGVDFLGTPYSPSEWGPMETVSDLANLIKRRTVPKDSA
jgi:hypothetical protein